MMVTSCRLAVSLLVLMSGAGLLGAHAARVPRAANAELLQRPVDSLLLEQHNVFRQEERAANIYRMRWNGTVEAAASRWVARCNFEHELSGEYGENLFYDSNKGEDKEVLLGGLEAWHEEKRAWRYTSAACGSACHYTQMIWSSTTELGCAFKRCPALRVGSRSVANAMYLVCFYYPRGNWIGEFPFKSGIPCSKCGSDTCDSGLCVSGSKSTEHQEVHTDEAAESVALHAPQQLVWRTSYEQHSASAQSDAGRHSYTYSRTEHRGPHGAGYSHAEGHYSSPRGSQGFSQAHYSRPGLERADALASQALSDPAAMERRDKSPLEVLREHDHWCRDRLPSCRIWTHDCRKSKSVYLACPRSCGHCNGGTQPSRDLHEQQVQETVLHLQAHREPQQQLRQPLEDVRLIDIDARRHSTTRDQDLQRQRTQQQQQQQQPLLQEHRRRDEGLVVASQRHPGRNDSANRSQSRNGEKNEREQQQRQQHRHQLQQNGRRETLGKEELQKIRQEKQQLRQQKLHQRQQKLHQRQQKQHQRQLKENQRQQKENQRQQKEDQRQQKSKQHQQQQPSRERSNQQAPETRIHPRYQTADKRAENLAENLRRVAYEGRCEDDVKYRDSCSYWVSMGFCHGNELVTNVYCKKSCRTC